MPSSGWLDDTPRYSSTTASSPASSRLVSVIADPFPPQVEPVRTAPVAVDGAPPEPRLDRRDVVDAHGPAEPPATCLPSRLDGHPERRGVDRRVIENVDHFEVAAVVQPEHEVARAERRVDAAVGECGTEARTKALHARRQSLGPRRVGEVVESHPLIVAHCGPCSAPGCNHRITR